MVNVIHSEKDLKTAQDMGLVKKTNIQHVVDEEIITPNQIRGMPKTSNSETKKMLEEQIDKMGRDGSQRNTKEVYEKIYDGIKKYS